jgi:dTDP-4-dehydrorhamnose 3,5-epimerase
VVYAGEDNPVIILIPAGIAHGYQVLGQQPVVLFYHVTQAYNPQSPDEQRLAFDDPEIGFDWSIQNR